MSDFFDELKRRNVVRVGIAYVLLAWAVAQVAELALDSFGAPDWVIKTILLTLALGLPFALFFSWAFELTPEGLKKEKDVDRNQSITHQTGRKLNTLIIGGLVVVIGMLLVDRFTSQTAAPDATTAPAEEVASHAASNSVAVLPFVDMSPNQDQEYFTDGLTENLLHALAQIRELKVAGRTSSFAFKGQNTDLREIGEQLNVSNILEGSVQKAGGRVRITTQLINASDGYHIWSKTFDRDLTDIFSVQDEIAYAVAGALRTSLLDEEVATHTPTTNNFDAYNAYLLGLSYYHKNTLDDYDKAVEQYELAISLDPEMALAWSGLSLAISWKTGFSSDFAAGYEKARDAAKKAIELDPNLADAWLALAEVQRANDWDWDGARASIDRAISLRPGDPDIVSLSARQKAIQGDTPTALAELEEALARDPLNTSLSRSYISTLVRAGRSDEALARATALAVSLPDAGAVHYAVGRLQLEAGDCEAALEAAKKEHFDFLSIELEGAAYHCLGEPEKADASVQQLLDLYGDDVSWQIATIHVAAGDKDKALAAIRRGIDVRDPGVVYMRSTRDVYELLRGDPRYDALLEEMGLPPSVP